MASEAPPPAEPPTEPLLDEPRTCRRHPGETAAFRCTFCHDPLCNRCGGTFEHRRYCDGCLAAVYAREREDDLQPERRGPTGMRIALIIVGGLLAFVGLLWLVLGGAYRRASERAMWKECEVALDRVHDAARMYADDHGGRLPASGDLRAGTLVDTLLADGYLHHRPKVTSPGTIFRPELRMDGDPTIPYIVDDAPHGDGKRHVLRVDGSVRSMTETEVANELARAATLTASPAPAMAPAPATTTSHPLSVPGGASVPTISVPGGGR